MNCVLCVDNGNENPAETIFCIIIIFLFFVY